MIIKRQLGQRPGPTDLTWDESHPADYLFRPVDLSSLLEEIEEKDPINQDGQEKKETYATWANSGDIVCEETDTGVLLTIRQPKNSSFAIRNEKGFLLQIIIDKTGEKAHIIRKKDLSIEIDNFNT